MADIAKLELVRDGAATLVFLSGAATQDIVADVPDERMTIIVQNLDTQTARVWIRKGDGIKSVDGDLYVDVAQNAVKIIGPLESARFKDMDTGRITVDITDDDSATAPSVFAGTITNVKIKPVYIP